MSSTELLLAKALVALFGLMLLGLGLAAGRLVIRGGRSRDEGEEKVPSRTEARADFTAIAALALLSLALLAAGTAILVQPGLFSPSPGR
jgi:hypothetical protein